MNMPATLAVKNIKKLARICVSNRNIINIKLVPKVMIIHPDFSYITVQNCTYVYLCVIFLCWLL